MDPQSFQDLVLRNRSFRRFQQSPRLTREALTELVNLARRTPSAGNRQPLKYSVLHTPEQCARMFPHTRWAGALKGWRGPAEGERPTAYILVFCDTKIMKEPGCDHGIAAQTICLSAAARGFGACMLGAIDRTKIRAEFHIPEHLELHLLIALGVPAEKVVLEEAKDGNVTYYRDEQSVHHVPKRPMAEALVELT
jgi:nitroreductase